MAYFTTSDHTKLYYEAFGEGEKTILFVHGWLDSGDSFKNIAGRLAEKYHIIVYDHRGHGRSETPKEGYNMTRLATDLRELIEFLAPQNLTLVGYSMGSHVLYEYVKLFGDADLDKLVITVMSPTLVNEERPELSLDSCLTWKMALERLAANNQYFAEGCEISYPNYLKTRGPNEKVREFYAKAAKLDSGAMVRLGIAMYAANYWSVLPSFTRPTLILSAEDDMYSRACHEEQARLIPRSKVVILEGCGHLLMMEKPEEYTRELAEFIQ